jgi:hypothetical protein
MKVVLTKEESEVMFHNALCNAIGTGYMSSYGLELSYDDDKYKSAKAQLKEKNSTESPCYEDVLMQVLRAGGQLTFEDIEGEGDMTRSIKLADVHKRVQKTPFRHLADAINENDDAVTADAIVQTVFFKEVVFG